MQFQFYSSSLPLIIPIYLAFFKPQNLFLLGLVEGGPKGDSPFVCRWISPTQSKGSKQNLSLWRRKKNTIFMVVKSILSFVLTIQNLPSFQELWRCSYLFVASNWRKIRDSFQHSNPGGRLLFTNFYSGSIVKTYWLVNLAFLIYHVLNFLNRSYSIVQPLLGFPYPHAGGMKPKGLIFMAASRHNTTIDFHVVINLCLSMWE